MSGTGGAAASAKIAPAVKKRAAGTAFALIALLAAGAILSLCAGSVRIPLRTAIAALIAPADAGTERAILLSLRLPRTLMAMLLGGALALSGYLLQTYFQNPIAGPFVLGISSGARMTLTIMLLLSPGGFFGGSWGMMLSAFAGALLSTFFILLIAGRVRHMAVLLVAGIMIGYITSAITDFLVNFAADQDIVNLHGWSQGSFSGMRMADVLAAGALTGAVFLLTLFLAKPIGAYQLGERYAAGMGVDVRRMRPVLILLSSLLAATVAAFAGPVSFVGIAVPFLIRRMLRTSRAQYMIPAAALGGAVFCLYADIIARTALAPAELSISTVTSAFGAPIVIAILLERRGGRDA